jgi:hypothetical protein
MSTRFFTQSKRSFVAVAVIALIAASAFAQEAKEPYLDFEGGPQLLGPDDGLGRAARAAGSAGAVGSLGGWSGQANGPSAVAQGFKGVSQFDLRSLLAGSSFIPPDTMGAVGATQFMETTNGVYAIYSKANGAVQSMVSAKTFWANAGMNDGSGLNGDARVMYDKPSQRWIAIQFGLSVADIQIAVSKTSDATGAWQSTKFTGFAGGTADYPTLAIDSKAIYIGTNNYNAANAFSGTTLNVIARSDLLGAGAPTTASLKQFNTPYVAGGLNNQDRGFAIQGVNSTGANAGQVIAASLFNNDSIRYNVANPGTAGATLGPVTQLGLTNYGDNNGARQPDGTRNVDPLDQRIGASAWEQNGKIYAVYTATAVGGDHTEVRWVVTNAATNAVIQEGVIGDATHDFYEGSLTVNSSGQVVIGFNRSGFSALDGNVSFLARTFNSDATGKLVQTNELLLHVSPVSDYHNGSFQGAAAVGRQRWGDYSAVTLDPNDDQSFWAIGQYAELWNNAAGCGAANPPIAGCTLSGGSAWGTWIAQITLDQVGAVPEPETYALMFGGLLAMAAVVRRKKAALV